MNANIREMRADILNDIANAKTVEHKTALIEELSATLSERESSVYNGGINRIATELAHLRHTYEAVEQVYKQAMQMALAFGFPTDEKIPTVSNELTVQITSTVKAVDVDALREECAKNNDVADKVNVAIAKKRDSITIESLSIKDLQSAKCPIVPTKDKPQFKTYIRDVKKA